MHVRMHRNRNAADSRPAARNTAAARNAVHRWDARAGTNQAAETQGLMEAVGRRRKQVEKPAHSEQTAMQVGVCPREAPTGCPQEALRGSLVHRLAPEASDMPRPAGTA
jgi:hypothetical protein